MHRVQDFPGCAFMAAAGTSRPHTAKYLPAPAARHSSYTCCATRWESPSSAPVTSTNSSRVHTAIPEVMSVKASEMLAVLGNQLLGCAQHDLWRSAAHRTGFADGEAHRRSQDVVDLDPQVAVGV